MKKVILKDGLFKAVTTLLMLVLVLALKGSVSEAASNYVVVNGTKLTSSTSGSGYSYDVSTNTVTLNNYKGGAVYSLCNSDLTIILKNSNTVTCGDLGSTYAAIYTPKNLKISGTSGSSLNINYSTASQEVVGIGAEGTLNISNTNLNINTHLCQSSSDSNYGFGIFGSGAVTLDSITGTIYADMAGASRTSITVKNSSCDKYIHKSTCSGCNVNICFFFDTATAPDFSDLALAPSNSGEIAKLGISSTVKFQKSSGTTVDSSTDITKIVNYEFTNGNLKYKITANKTVAVTGATSTSLKSITIPATVTNGGTKYKVTSIEANAFKNYTNLKKVVIGKNIKTIGKKAFYGDKKLKTVKIKSSKITSIGKNAFKKISTKATIKCPSSKLKAYKKLLKKSGISGKVTIK